jgi:hypothetical protein
MLDGRFDDVSMVIDVGQILAPRHSGERHTAECSVMFQNVFC